MATYNLGYEVPWQLSPARSEEDPATARVAAAGAVAEERLQALARFTGLLAEADVTAIVNCQREAITVQVAEPLTPWLVPGAHLVPADHLGPVARSATAALLGGRQAWLDCLPPPGFRAAALLAAPMLARPGHLVLVASFCRRFDKRDLGLAGLYLAGTREGPRGPGGQNIRLLAA